MAPITITLKNCNNKKMFYENTELFFLNRIILIICCILAIISKNTEIHKNNKF